MRKQPDNTNEDTVLLRGSLIFEGNIQMEKKKIEHYSNEILSTNYHGN